MGSSTTASASTLPAPALAASRAALNAAFADQQSAEPVKSEGEEAGVIAENGNGDEQSLEPGEIQEVNMEAQAEGIRTVFSDPTNFNVKASHCTEVRLKFECLQHLRLCSTPSTLLGLSGLTLPLQKAEICHRRLYRLSLRLRCPKHPVDPPLSGGWRISRG